MTANELDPSGAGGSAGQGGSISSAAPSQPPGGAADLDLDAIEARADAATPSPWHIEDHWDETLDETFPIVCGPEPRGVPRQGIADVFEASAGDAGFIAAARTDVPALIAEVRALRARCLELQTQLDLKETTQ